MAKVNTNKARKAAGVRVDLPTETSPCYMCNEDCGLLVKHHYRVRYVLRSDGTVLASGQSATEYAHSTQSLYWGSANYKVIGKLKDDVRLAGKFDLVAFATRKHPDAEAIIPD